MSELKSDVTIVGGGIAGLWSAKELVDQGYSVNIIESSPHLATGATTRNEGWLHAGTYHSVGIENYDDAKNVVERTQYGHRAIADFAPESIEHEVSYAFVHEPEATEEAVRRWQDFGVVHQELSALAFKEYGFDTDRINAAFKVEDKSVNSRIICDKLARYVASRGVKILTDTVFHPLEEGLAEISRGDTEMKVRSDQFLITAGVGIKNVVEELTGVPFPMRYFKSHLLVTPRLTEDNYFYVDWNEAGVMTHGDSTIVGYNRDSIEIPLPDYDVIPDKNKLVYDALVRLLPGVKDKYPIQSKLVMGVACVKPDVVRPDSKLDANARQDLNINVFEVASGYACAIPGKMTEAPALGRAVMNFITNGTATTSGSNSTKEVTLEDWSRSIINLRPADLWMASQGLSESEPI